MYATPESLPAELNFMIVTAISRGMGSAATDTVQSQHKRNPIANTPAKRKKGIEDTSTLTFVVLTQHDRTNALPQFSGIHKEVVVNTGGRRAPLKTVNMQFRGTKYCRADM